MSSETNNTELHYPTTEPQCVAHYSGIIYHTYVILYLILRVAVSCMNSHGEQMGNSASNCCTVRSQAQCHCDMAAWFRCYCIAFICLLRTKVLSEFFSLYDNFIVCHHIFIFNLYMCFILGDTGLGVLEWIKMVWKEEFQFQHIKLIFPTADPM